VYDVDFDHVALAAEERADLYPRYVAELGGAWEAGMTEAGFAWTQVRYANDARVELLEPHEPERNDFLRRFLDQSGPGPHHLTFKVSDIRVALERAETLGYEPVGVNLSEPVWQEAFLHPRSAHGVVVQLAQTADGDWTPPPPPSEFPTPGPRRVDLVRVTHAVADVDAARVLWVDLLGGHVADTGAEPGQWMDLVWPGGRLRLIEPAGGPLDAWLGQRPGRIHDLTFVVADPAVIGGAHRVASDSWQVEPADNLGTRLRLEQS
jgi:methylmalonyl-CoA/ethylmalonyl-CoA epimerase